jgi:hypothetical protein
MSLIFSVTEQAAARLDPQTLYSTVQWQDASGDFFTVYVDEFADGGNDTLRGDLDLTNVAAAPVGGDTASRDNPVRMSERCALGELRLGAG